MEVINLKKIWHFSPILLLFLMGCSHTNVWHFPQPQEPVSDEETIAENSCDSSEVIAVEGELTQPDQAPDKDIISEEEEQIPGDNELPRDEKEKDEQTLLRLEIPRIPHIENCKNYYLKKYRRGLSHRVGASAAVYRDDPSESQGEGECPKR